MSEQSPIMPSLQSGFFGFHHTVDSALKVLSELGVSASRITLRMDGRGLPSRWIVAQDPLPGEELGPGVSVTLSVAGLGYFHALPVGMWDKGGEDGPGTREIMELVDDPLQKATHWIREGARLFDIQPDNMMACSRWISLFGLNPDDWPAETWYNLSLLLPSLQALAATERGIRLVFRLLLDLPVKEIRYFPSFRKLPTSEWSLLGERSCRLGVDHIVGDQTEDLAGTSLVVGPVPLQTYYDYQKDDKIRLFRSVLDLCISCQRQCRVSWLVLDAERMPRLGYATENSRLGINSHLGRLAAV